jgi:hypothetical protein
MFLENMDKKDIAKKALNEVSKQIPLKSKHIRYNYVPSEDNFHGDNPLTRYSFAIVDNRASYRKEISEKIRDKLASVNDWVIPIEPSLEFKVKESEWGLLLVTYDALISPNTLKLSDLGRDIKRDYKLIDKQFLSIEDYLRRIYE